MSSQCRGGSLLLILLLIPLDPTRAQVPRLQSESPPATSKLGIERTIAVTHEEEQDGWRVAETANFRLLHRHTHALAEAVLRTAEHTRTVQMRKWFDAVGEKWNPKCILWLYPSGEAYGEATGAPVHPGGGHTDVQAEDGRVLSRRIHLHGTQTHLLEGLVPHEVTHAVLAGRLGRERVPRWADEGMAILAEAKPQIDVHLRLLPRWRAEEALFSTRGLIEMRDYPESRSLGVFYAQSVSLVDFLTRQKGAKHFADFVREGEREGYEAALRKHYDWNFAELDRRWRHHAFYHYPASDPTTTSGGG